MMPLPIHLYTWNMPFIVGMLFLACFSTASAEPKNIRIVEQKESDGVSMLVETTHCLAATITLEAQLHNLAPSASLPLTVDTEGRTSFELIRFRIKDPNQKWNFHYDYHWEVGGRGGIHDDHQVYQLPYEVGRKYVVGQGHFGSFSHQKGSENEHAIDWLMPPGTKVCAAREGTVVVIFQDSNEGGSDKKFKNAGNYVIVRHEDGTFAEYVHIQKDGAQVNIGKHVKAGDMIALSGNTGYSTRPHLHFMVFRTLNGEHRQSIPVQFKTRNGITLIPKQGQSY